MIHAFNFTCARDRELSELMEMTLCKYGPKGIRLNVINTDMLYPDYGNGSGWKAGMMKVDYMKSMSFADDDWVLSVDSDVVFCNSNVFDLLDPQYGIIGIQGQQPWNTFYGQWPHMSGCLIFLRGDIARQMTVWQAHTFEEIRRNHFKSYAITENEDVMLSYFARMAGASAFDISIVPGTTSNDFEQDIINCGQVAHNPLLYRKMASFYHINYCPTQFIGESVTGKWMIPEVLKKKGIEL